ncbi:hypothetical protein AVEN_81381-1 [Araneus ventricosus]|uniref:Uncharacterized protein n=1 Tax=Araneus ventricosus TaxID=182803 RepID=A0A4Y2B8Y0_ARAVE|nr:hypothetical protein AVEN_81381-1 [Araneus ventricosus]
MGNVCVAQKLMRCSNVPNMAVTLLKVMTSETLTDVNSSMHENHGITVREISEGYGSDQSFLSEDLGVRLLFTRFVLKLLSSPKRKSTVNCARSP